MQQRLCDWHNGIAAASLPRLHKSISTLALSSSQSGPVPAIKSADKNEPPLAVRVPVTLQMESATSTQA